MIKLNMDSRAERLLQLLELLSPYAHNLHEIYDEILANVASVLPNEDSPLSPNTDTLFTSRFLRRPLVLNSPQPQAIANPFYGLGLLAQQSNAFLFNFNSGMLNAVGNSLDNVLQTSTLQTSNRRPEAPPSVGSNSEKLEESGCTDIPEEYCCKLSCAIMTIPVYDPKHPDIKFEKEWILRALSQKAENPYTRTPLLAADLKEDTKLKEKIDAFVEEKTNGMNINTTTPWK